MPIVGNLSEFPLPEVLLLIGARTGRLRLLDVSEHGMMELDFSSGEMQALYLGQEKLEDPEAILSKLSTVVQRSEGMFEFRLQPIFPVLRTKPLMINQLVMSLVWQVDEDCARGSRDLDNSDYYKLEEPEPHIWIEPELYAFFQSARQFFHRGTTVQEISESFKLPPQEVRQRLTNLRLLGFISQAGFELELPRMDVEKRSNELALGSRISEELQKITSHLPLRRQTAV